MREERNVRPGVDMVSFDSTEEMLEWMGAAQAEVQARRLAREQEEVLYGSHAVRFIDGLTIFIWVPLLIEWNEDAYVLDRIDHKQAEENMLYSWAYSTAVPAGELGYTHRSVLWPISDRCFEAARQAGWSVPHMVEWAKADLTFAAGEMRSWLTRSKR